MPRPMLPPGALHNIANRKEFNATEYTLELEQLFDNTQGTKRWKPLTTTPIATPAGSGALVFSDLSNIFLSDSTTQLIGYFHD